MITRFAGAFFHKWAYELTLSQYGQLSVDHNFNDINYNELGANLIMGKANFNLKYLEENNHIGSSNYIKSDLKVELDESNQMSFDFRRNLETESTEFYSMAYNYFNDCLKAGVIFRRKFYEDRDIQHEDTLMFKISLIPLGDAHHQQIYLDQLMHSLIL